MTLLSLLVLVGCATNEAPKGIILVSLDTLRADRLGAYGSTRGLTPNLDRFAAEGVVFDQGYAQSNETLYSHASLFTGQYPSRLGVLDGGFRLPAKATTLAGAFRGASWQTAAFVAGGHLAAPFGLGGGFDVYNDASSFGSIRETADLALRWLDETASQEAPFFLFVHGYDTHDRYLKPTPFGYAAADPAEQGVGATVARTVGAASNIVDGYASDRIDLIEILSQARPRFERGRGIAEVDPEARKLAAEDVQHLAATYDGAVAWADACFGLFMAGLRERGLLDEVLIVVVSDHGEELGEQGVFNHRTSMSDATAHVPLLVRLPGGANGGRRVTGLVELIDVAPTLLDLAGVGSLDSPGQSLRGALEGGTWTGRSSAITEGALRMLSVRGPAARLSVEGLRLENPFLPAMIAVAPIDGVTVTLTGDVGEGPALREALVRHMAGGG